MKKISVIIIIIALLLIGLRIAQPIRSYITDGRVLDKVDPLFENTHYHKTAIRYGQIDQENFLHIGYIILVAVTLVYLFENNKQS